VEQDKPSRIITGNDSDNEDDDDDDDESEEAGGIRDAAAAMIVGVGSLYDPPECQGMAHFLEHLLFMGSAKYPTENAYDAFMTKHGGNDNAYTEMEHTVYHFDIPQEHLPKALDIFAQFFIHPLMLESSVDRELNAVESEFQLVKNSDNTRAQQLMCHTAGRTAEEHPGVKVRGPVRGYVNSVVLCSCRIFRLLTCTYVLDVIFVFCCLLVKVWVGQLQES
jgi:hypothetical protein